MTLEMKNLNHMMTFENYSNESLSDIKAKVQEVINKMTNEKYKSLAQQFLDKISDQTLQKMFSNAQKGTSTVIFPDKKIDLSTIKPVEVPNESFGSKEYWRKALGVTVGLIPILAGIVAASAAYMGKPITLLGTVIDSTNWALAVLVVGGTLVSGIVLSLADKTGWFD